MREDGGEHPGVISPPALPRLTRPSCILLSHSMPSPNELGIHAKLTVSVPISSKLYVPRVSTLAVAWRLSVESGSTTSPPTAARGSIRPPSPCCYVPPPDGLAVGGRVPHGQDVHRAVVLIRGRWEESSTSLVGHSSHTLAASFSPIIYHKPAAAAAPAPAVANGGASPGDNANGTPPSPAPKGGHQVVAVAGQDRVVTVWLAAANRPVAILREVFDKPPSDLSWGADGYTLLVSGHDGSVIVLRFTPEELGVPLPEVGRFARGR